MKRALALVAPAIVLVVGWMVLRAVQLAPPELPGPAAGAAVEVDSARLAERLSRAIQFETVSRQGEPRRDEAEFERFLGWLERTYAPLVAEVDYERVGDLTPLFEWRGSDPSLSPILLTAHYDVVPVTPGTEGDWTQPPFSGAIVDGSVWGRGALDDKSAMIAQLEAVSALLADGFEPARTLYLSFGHDEEIGGPVGAGGVARKLREEGEELEWSLDEGSFVIDGMFPGVAQPVASINVAEKGSVTLELVARAQGGHSSVPPAETAVGILAQAVTRVQGAPLPGGLEGVAAEMFESAAAHMSFSRRFMFSNLWLFGPLVERSFSGGGFMNAMMRTTTAPTMLRGGIKSNVLPPEAVATVNFRLHPRDTPEGVIEHVRRAIDDERVEIRTGGGRSASPVASTDSAGYAAIARATRQTFGDVIVIPGLTVAGTDSKHYAQVARDAYRFNPMVVTQKDAASFHGTNEHLSIENLAQATRFYIHLLRATAGG